MKLNEHKIKEIIPGSIAEELELEPGDVLLKINDTVIEDIFDYQYLVEDDYIEVLVKKATGEEWLLEVDKEPDEDLGITFENGLMDDYKSCHNKCIFCFIDQMPKGMRETLYFKDDDSRLSFLQGNYVTLTNMADKDINRIIRYNLGPINISVHTTNPELRCKMLNNRFAGEALKKIDTLYEGGIQMNGQIVLCKGINDGEELKRSIRDLERYIPCMQSVSVVPAGLTKYREGLFELESFEQEDAKIVIDLIEEFQRKFYDKYEIHFIHASDEWYILAEREFPEEERYDGYIQLENGVGMMRLLWNEFQEALGKLKKDSQRINQIRNFQKKTISIATGVLAYDMIRKLSDILMEEFEAVEIQCYKIINHYFGEKITVSGLITATDLIEQLKDKELGDVLLLPSNILRSGEDVFLDDITLPELKNTLQLNINIVESSGQGFIDAILNVFDGNTEMKHKENGNFVYIQAYENSKLPNRNKGKERKGLQE